MEDAAPYGVVHAPFLYGLLLAPEHRNKSCIHLVYIYIIVIFWIYIVSQTNGIAPGTILQSKADIDVRIAISGVKTPLYS